MAEPTTNAITKQQKYAALIMGGLFVLFGAVATIWFLLDSVGLFERPQQVTMAEAAEVANRDYMYAEIEDANVLCDRVAYREGRSSSTGVNETRYTDVWMVNDDETIGIFATYSGRLTCDDILGDDHTGYLKGTGFSLPGSANPLPLGQGADYLELCMYCGTSNSLALLAGFGLAILIGGAMLYGAITKPVVSTEELAEQSTT